MNPENNNNPYQPPEDEVPSDMPQPEENSFGTTPELNTPEQTPTPEPVNESPVPVTTNTPFGAPEPVAAETQPVGSAAPAPGSDGGSGKKKSKLVPILAVVLAVLLLGVGTAFALQHFMGDSDEATTSEERSEESDTVEDAEDEAPVSVEPSELAVNKTITDEDLGYTINATKLVVSPFAVPERYSAAHGDKVVVLVEASVSTEGRYTGAPSVPSLRLVDASGKEVASTTILDTEMENAGYTPAPATGPTGEGTVSGYAAYLVEAGQTDDLTLRYNRQATTIIGGSNVAAKTFDVKLND